MSGKPAAGRMPLIENLLNVKTEPESGLKPPQGIQAIWSHRLRIHYNFPDFPSPPRRIYIPTIVSN